jgi:hypothetical protein
MIIGQNNSCFPPTFCPNRTDYVPGRLFLSLLLLMLRMPFAVLRSSRLLTKTCKFLKRSIYESFVILFVGDLSVPLFPVGAECHSYQGPGVE